MFFMAANIYGTDDVIESTGFSGYALRQWAAANDVTRVGSAFVWTDEDVEDFLEDQGSDEDDDGDE